MRTWLSLLFILITTPFFEISILFENIMYPVGVYLLHIYFDEACDFINIGASYLTSGYSNTWFPWS